MRYVRRRVPRDAVAKGQATRVVLPIRRHVSRHEADDGRVFPRTRVADVVFMRRTGARGVARIPTTRSRVLAVSVKWKNHHPRLTVMLRATGIRLCARRYVTVLRTDTRNGALYRIELSRHTEPRAPDPEMPTAGQIAIIGVAFVFFVSASWSLMVVDDMPRRRCITDSHYSTSHSDTSAGSNDSPPL